MAWRLVLIAAALAASVVLPSSVSAAPPLGCVHIGKPVDEIDQTEVALTQCGPAGMRVEAGLWGVRVCNEKDCPVEIFLSLKSELPPVLP